MQIEENRLLAPFTTFGIGGPARWFVEAGSEDEIAEAAAWAEKRGVRLFVLGGGSNLLVSDAGFDGLVLRVRVRRGFAWARRCLGSASRGRAVRDAAGRGGRSDTGGASAAGREEEDGD